MIRPISLLLGLLALLMLASPAIAAGGYQTLISGGNLPNPIRLAPADEDALYRRINTPPRLDQTPVFGGIHYTVTSDYWDKMVRGSHTDKAPADKDAAYFPDGGYLRVIQSADSLWYELDLRQQALLNRYIRLDQQGDVSQRPGLLEVLAAAAKTEPVPLQISARQLTTAEAASFWKVAAGLKPAFSSSADTRTPASTPDGVWLIFGLPEGHASQMLYEPGAATLVDSTGTETYKVPSGWLGPVMGADAPQPGVQNNPAGRIHQERGTGSPVWWLLMLGGGGLCLGAAIWLRKHPEALRRLPFLGD